MPDLSLLLLVEIPLGAMGARDSAGAAAHSGGRTFAVDPELQGPPNSPPCSGGGSPGSAAWRVTAALAYGLRALPPG